jgi:hypothetical protein
MFERACTSILARSSHQGNNDIELRPLDIEGIIPEITVRDVGSMMMARAVLLDQGLGNYRPGQVASANHLAGIYEELVA